MPAEQQNTRSELPYRAWTWHTGYLGQRIEHCEHPVGQGGWNVPRLPGPTRTLHDNTDTSVPAKQLQNGFLRAHWIDAA